MSKAAPLFFRHSDVMAEIIMNEVTVFLSEGRQCNVPAGLKHELWPKGEENTFVFHLNSYSTHGYIFSFIFLPSCCIQKRKSDMYNCCLMLKLIKQD